MSIMSLNIGVFLITIFPCLVLCEPNNAIENKILDLPLNSSVVGTKVIIRPGRHVCTSERVISKPIPAIETYKRPVYTPRVRKNCLDPTNCPQFDVKYEIANRTVYLLQKSSTFEHSCCPGWIKGNAREKGCMKPICSKGCGDFGVCVQPEVCKCRTGYSGEMCDTDIDECRSTSHGCQQICQNTAGSYVCACQEGFQLGSDGKRCDYCFTCQKEYVDMVARMKMLQNMVIENINKEVNTTTLDLMASRIGRLEFELANVTQEKRELLTNSETFREQMGQLEFELTNVSKEKLEMLTYQKEMNDKMAKLESDLEVERQEKINLTTRLLKLELDLDDASSGKGSIFTSEGDLFDRVASLEQELQNVTAGKALLEEQLWRLQNDFFNISCSKNAMETTVVHLLESYDDIMEQIDGLRNDTQLCKSSCPPGKSHDTSGWSTAKPHQQDTTTADAPSTSPSSSFTSTEPALDPISMLYSLSNQIGMLEEQLDLCKCHERRPYR